MTKIEQDIKDIKEAICIISDCDYRVDGVVEASKRLIEIVDKWEKEDKE